MAFTLIDLVLILVLSKALVLDLFCLFLMLMTCIQYISTAPKI